MAAITKFVCYEIIKNQLEESIQHWQFCDVPRAIYAKLSDYRMKLKDFQ